MLYSGEIWETQFTKCNQMDAEFICFCLINPIVATVLKKLYHFKVSIHPLNKKQLNYILGVGQK